jgi:hypothetical protein
MTGMTGDCTPAAGDCTDVQGPVMDGDMGPMVPAGDYAAPAMDAFDTSNPEFASPEMTAARADVNDAVEVNADGGLDVVADQYDMGGEPGYDGCPPINPPMDTGADGGHPMPGPFIEIMSQPQTAGPVMETMGGASEAFSGAIEGGMDAGFDAFAENFEANMPEGMDMEMFDAVGDAMASNMPEPMPPMGEMGPAMLQAMNDSMPEGMEMPTEMMESFGDMFNDMSSSMEEAGITPEEFGENFGDNGAHGDCADINGDMGGCSGDMTGVSGDMGAMQGDFSGVQGDVTGMEGDVTGIQGDVSNMEGDCSAIHGDCAGIQGDVTGVSGDMTDVAGDMGPMQGDYTDHAGPAMMPPPAPFNVDAALDAAGGESAGMHSMEAAMAQTGDGPGPIMEVNPADAALGQAMDSAMDQGGAAASGPDTMAGADGDFSYMDDPQAGDDPSSDDDSGLAG